MALDQLSIVATSWEQFQQHNPILTTSNDLPRPRL